jgi:hypothetical protein
MTKQTRGSNRKGRRGDPNQDVQPWLGWIAALLVVVIVVVAVAMGMERTGNERNRAAEVRMTPLVGGMEMPVATETGAAVALASQVTPIPEAISGTGAITMVTVITNTGALSETDTFTATGDMTPTVTVSANVELSPPVTAPVTGEITATESVTTGVAATATFEMTSTVEISATAEMTSSVTTEPTIKPTASATARPTATVRPTATATAIATVVSQVFDTGDMVVASNGRVEVHADASQGALILDSVGNGAVLEVLDPSGDYAGYPVEVDGHGWVRVRAEDGLVGWVMTDQVEAQ